MNENELNDLILDIWLDFEELKVNPESAEVLIPNSMPLLWFGDLPAYEKSDLKILTVSKNASYAEFGENQRFEKLLTELSSVNLEIYKSNLNQYFEYNPSSWFNQLAKFFPIFDAAYKQSENQINRALHIDLFTPIPTEPVWPNLTKSQQSQFVMKFPQIMQILKPDILLTSLSVSNLKILLKNAGTEIEEIFNEEELGKSAKYVRAYRLYKKLIVINGRNFQGTYFGGMADLFVQKCLREIKKMM